MIALSVLELVRVREGSGPREALDNARDLAQHAERLGYTRFWVAEHHNMPGIASAATSLAIAHIAAGTNSIRVGAGGVMLSNHSPLVIAEQFGTLAVLFGDRIDLGVGRAPGTDRVAMQAMRRDVDGAQTFPYDVLELLAYFEDRRPGQQVVAVPATGTDVPVWILGSSTYGAQLAAKLGLPYAFASQFAPQELYAALRAYREAFQPSKYLSEPYAMAGVNVIVAGTDAEARRLATTQAMSFTDMLRNRRGLSKPPIDDIETYWSAEEKLEASRMLACSIVGSPATVNEGVKKLAASTGVDELIVVSDVFDHAARKRSYELLMSCVREDSLTAV